MTPTDLDRIGRALYGRHYKPELVKALGVSQRSLDYYVAGKRGIPDDMKERLAKLAIKRVAEITRAVAA